MKCEIKMDLMRMRPQRFRQASEHLCNRVFLRYDPDPLVPCVPLSYIVQKGTDDQTNLFNM